ncbi:mpp10 protein [Lichtheimia corymbifera JMRC:FSU:9682]|uniref:U3 small nucleolar ribonucleoprotein protein MPP10 n=1 Tax=Lichtheimia corymbifera JMRC:FSU:9682 TaxID=1263082 RepID=A0A068RL02_9FUNG|nr:mpp10 protein [Lichtheimia corymbifera JMRC:FSU:9682]
MVATKKRTNPVNRFITNVVDKPQVFFAADTKIVNQALAMAKHFYDTAKQHETMEFSPFPELLTEGFETEQIWEEIASQNEPFLHYAKSTVKEYSRKRKRSEIEYDEQEDDDASISGQSMELEHDDDVHEEEDEEEYDEMLENDDDNEALQQFDEDEDDEDLEEQVEDEEEEDIEEEEPSSTKRSEVDDDFFNLDKFNKWTEDQEELDMMSDRDEDEDDIDYDEDLEEVDDEDEDDDALVDASEMTFKDFFLAPAKRRGGAKPEKKKVQFADEEPSNDEDEADVMDEDDDEEQEPKTRSLFEDDEEEEEDNTTSAHEKRLERIQEQIEQFEQENIQDKHWTLKGETDAKARPVNSLLEEDLEFEQSVKPVPVITQEVTSALEEIIKKRILDNQFDDVERKQDPQERPFLPSKKIDISDERSKKSLAELYEEDYMKQKTGDTTNEKDAALEQEHQAITDLFNELCGKLDSLSNFHFTPKQPKADLNIVSDAPAISMEEAMPVNMSDATLLAPEEVYDKKRGEVKSKEEMTQEERKRAHAKKKQQKRKERALKEREMKLIHKQNPGLGNKHAKMKAVKELMGAKNVEIIKNK